MKSGLCSSSTYLDVYKLPSVTVHTHGILLCYLEQSKDTSQVCEVLLFSSVCSGIAHIPKTQNKRKLRQKGFITLASVIALFRHWWTTSDDASA